jgi:RNA polymerase sigma-70 factor (ECF subfamily)
LFRIARNLAIDLLRRRKFTLESLHIGTTIERHLVAEHDVVETAWVSLQQEQVHLALAELPPEQRDVINWIYFQGKTRREIAQEKEIPFGTINTRAKLALDKLRRALQAQGYHLEE